MSRISYALKGMDGIWKHHSMIWVPDVDFHVQKKIWKESSILRTKWYEICFRRDTLYGVRLGDDMKRYTGFSDELIDLFSETCLNRGVILKDYTFLTADRWKTERDHVLPHWNDPEDGSLYFHRIHAPLRDVSLICKETISETFFEWNMVWETTWWE
jgi:hypothetical protein